MKPLNRKQIQAGPSMPLRVLQFGEGNFLRAFADYAFHTLNQEADYNAGVAVVQPIREGMASVLQEQDGLYTLFMQGLSRGEAVRDQVLIDCIQTAVDPYTDFEAYLALARDPHLEFAVSNTTESGIAFNPEDLPHMRPPASFPAKLAVWLYERYRHFGGRPEAGLEVIPCELIDRNGEALRELVLRYAEHWDWEPAFGAWLKKHIRFHNSLVDRIVPGYPKEDPETYQALLPYQDRLMVTSEHFFLWVIEGDGELARKLPFGKTGLDVKVVADLQPYRTRKVRILNGAHTALVPMALLHGLETVSEAVDDPFAGPFIREAVFEEILPTLDMDPSGLEAYATAVFERFRNPFIRHRLASIVLNSVSKFKVRVLPSLLEYHRQTGRLPLRLVYGFACLFRFYRGSWQGRELPVSDAPEVIGDFQSLWQEQEGVDLVRILLARETYWGINLNTLPGLADALSGALEHLEAHGVAGGFRTFMQNAATT